MLPPIARLAPEIIQEVDSYLSFPDQIFLRQTNKVHFRNKLRSARRPCYIHQGQIEYLMRTAFYARNSQRRSGRYSQDEIFCHGCLALRPARSFDDLSRIFTGPLPVTTEEIMRNGENRFCISCSLNLNPLDGTPKAYHSGQIILVDRRPLSRCPCCQRLQGDLLRVRFDHHGYATFRKGCPVCGVCAACFSAPHDCDLILNTHRQSIGMLVHSIDYPTVMIPKFTTDVSIILEPEYQASVRRLRLACWKTDKIWEKLFHRHSHKNRRNAVSNKKRRASRR